MFKHEAKKLFYLLCKEKSCYILSLTNNHICQYFTSKEGGLVLKNYSEKIMFQKKMCLRDIRNVQKTSKDI